MSKANIILTGFMATGKTTVGKRLAAQLGYDFVDTDELIIVSDAMQDHMGSDGPMGHDHHGDGNGMMMGGTFGHH